MTGLGYFPLGSYSHGHLPSDTVAYIGFLFRGGGGGLKYFGKVGVFARGDRSHAFTMAFGGMFSGEDFEKWCNLVRFGEYFAKTL